jgi:hypothetical protein
MDTPTVPGQARQPRFTASEGASSQPFKLQNREGNLKDGRKVPQPERPGCSLALFPARDLLPRDGRVLRGIAEGVRKTALRPTSGLSQFLDQVSDHATIFAPEQGPP